MRVSDKDRPLRGGAVQSLENPDPVERLVLIDATGVARPVGEVAASELSARAGAAMSLMASPPDVLVMHRAEGPAAVLAGEIHSTSRLHDVCSMVAQARWRGELVVCDAQARRSLFLNDGQVVGAHSTAEPERLGAVLSHYGVMSRAEVEEAAQLSGGRMRFGDAAVKLGYVTRETLYRFLVKQTELIVYATVSVQRGSFVFFDDFQDEVLALPLSMSLAELMMEGVRRMDEMEFFRHRIPSTDCILERGEGRPPSQEGLRQTVWAAIDGRRSVDEIAAATGHDLFEVMREVYELTKTDSVVVRQPSEGGHEGVVRIFNDALQMIMAEVDKYPGASRDIRDSLASFAASGVVYDPIFRGAGPRPDGTLDPAKVAENMANVVEPGTGEGALAEWLYEYASFAMFIAEPVLRAGSRSDAAEVSSQVSALLAPLAPRL
ncbi:MAG: DUF4388 domain-containing protein [Myxococcales bacterium]|nr:DUF4388 domain-containing protein [Myxococcales bacterium]